MTCQKERCFKKMKKQLTLPQDGCSYTGSAKETHIDIVCMKCFSDEERQDRPGLYCLEQRRLRGHW